MNQIFEFLGISLLDNVSAIESNKTIYYDDNIQKVASIKALKKKIQNSLFYWYNKTLFPDNMRKFFRSTMYLYEKHIKSNSVTENPQKLNADTRKWLRDLYY